MPLLCARSLVRFLAKCIFLLCHSLSFFRPYPKLLPVAVVVVLAAATATSSTAVTLLDREMYVEEENTSARALKTQSRRMRVRILKANACVVFCCLCVSACLPVQRKIWTKRERERERKG